MEISKSSNAPCRSPARGQVRIKVEACGICHSDALVKEGLWPGLQYPRVPGHEIAGRVDAVGPDVTLWKTGTARRRRLARRTLFPVRSLPPRRFHQLQVSKVTGIHFDGGYAEYMIAPAEAVALIPEDLPADEAAPLLCAGITVFNALAIPERAPDNLVAVQGIGGLGHLGIQYARQMGFRTVAIGRGSDKKALATKLGAHEYLDTSAGFAGRGLAEDWAGRASSRHRSGLEIDVRAGRWTRPERHSDDRWSRARNRWPSHRCSSSLETSRFAAGLQEPLAIRRIRWNSARSAAFVQ